MSRSSMLSVAIVLCCDFSSVDAQAIHEFPLPDGTVRTAMVSGNLLYVGGDFGYLGPETGRGVPIDALTGQAPSSIAKVTGVEVLAVAPDGAGGWYIGGDFTDVDGTPRSNIAHILADNTVSGWNPSANGVVRALAVDGSTVYVGGSFTSIGGQARNYIAALDATTGNATAWDPNASGGFVPYVLALALSGSTVYAGGQFTSIGGQARNRIAALDATTGNATAWDPNVSGGSGLTAVNTVAVSGSTVYVGGNFTSIGFQPRNHIAALDAATGAATTWNPNAGYSVHKLVVTGSTVYAGGRFQSIGGQLRIGIAALDAVTGIATPWNPNPGGDVVHVNALAVSGSTVYVGGHFTTIGGQPRNYIAAVDASTGAATAWNPSASFSVHALAVSGSTVYAGGSFTSVGGSARRGLAALDLTTKQVTAWDPKVTGDPVEIHALALSGSTLYFGGRMTAVGGVLRNGIAAVDAATGALTPWNPGVGFVRVDALALGGSTVYVGGAFDQIGGQLRDNIAALDMGTGAATAWNPNANGQVLALAVDGSTVYTGGSFTSIGGQSRASIAALDAASGLATPWSPVASGGGVVALAVSGSTVYAGGGFSSIGGAPRTFLAALDAATGNATSWNPAANASVLTLALSGSIVYAGGGFTSIGGQARTGLAALDMTTGSALNWSPNLGTACWDLEVSGSIVYAGGNFPARLVAIDNAVVGVPAPGFASLAHLSFANHPNPFRETTLLQFRLARETEVTLAVYDVSGREVARPADRKRFGPGSHEVPLDGQALPAGLYVCRLRAGEQSAARRVVRIP